MSLCKTVHRSLVAGAIRRYFASKKTVTRAQERHRDEKLMFGGVLETQKEKRKRARSQKNNGDPVKSIGTESNDSEAYWQLKSAPKSVKFLKIFGSQDVSDTSAQCDVPSEEVPQASRTPLKMQDILIRNITSVPLLMASESSTLVPNEDTSLYPSVTKILSATMSEASKQALERWKQKMIASLGEEGFLAHNRDQLAFGAKFHRLVKESLEGRESQVESDLSAVWNSVQPVLKHIANVRLLEENVFHKKLRYKGVVDCVASYRNTPCVIEWKVSEKQKPLISSTYDAPLQLTAYMGALSNATPLKIINGLVVVCYKNGSPAHAFPMDERSCRSHWSLWLSRLQHYWLQNSEQSPIAKETK